jgi:glycine/D-amino acid oxidase-like deaminating enzyme
VGTVRAIGRRVVVAAGTSGRASNVCNVIGGILADLVIDRRTGHDIGPFGLGGIA